MNPKPLLPVNERLLKTRHPIAYRRIVASSSRKPISYFYDDEQDEPVLMSVRGEHSFPTYGGGKKKALLKRWFDGLGLAKESLYAVSGFGDGSHLKHFLRESATGTSFLAAEKDPALLRETFARFDCSELLSNDRFILGVGEPDDEFFKDIQGAALSAIQEINLVVFSPLHLADESYYGRMRNELVRQYLVIRPLMEVNIRTATTIQENTFENLPSMACSPDVGEMKNEFSNIPFILVGAGPSLDESIEFLKEMQDKAIIAVSNSALRKLVNNQIKPHLVVTADPQSPTMAGFKGVNLDGLTLACPFSAYPEIIKKFQGRILSWCTFNPIIDVLKAGLGKQKGTPIMEQGTVSGCVLDLSRLFGCKKVLFVGQDMAIRSDGRYYTDDSSYSDHGGHYSPIEKGHRLQGNTEDEVLVEGRLFVYLKTFEQFIAKQSGVEYRNLARTGVKISGAPYLTLKEASEWIGQAENSAFSNRITELLMNQAETPDLANIFKSSRAYVEKLFEITLNSAVQTELLPEKFAGTNYSENKAIINLLKKGDEVNKFVDSNKTFWTLLFEGKTKAEMVHYRRIIRDISFESKNWSAVQRNKEYFWALSEGCHWLLNLMDENFSSETPEGLESVFESS